MLVLIYICAVVFTVTQTVTTKLYAAKCSNSVIFNAIKATIALLFFAIISLNGVRWHTPSVIFGFLYGVSLSLAMYTAYTSISLGIASLTSVLVSFSVLIPILYGVIFCNEEVSATKITGFICLIFALVSANIDKMRRTSGKETNYAKWILFVFATFLLNGTCSVLQKMHQNYYPGEFLKEFMVSAMIFSTVIFVVAFSLKVSVRDFKAAEGKRYAVISGVANAVTNYSTLALAGIEHASVLFPLISAGRIGTVIFCGS